MGSSGYVGGNYPDYKPPDGEEEVNIIEGEPQKRNNNIKLFLSYVKFLEKTLLVTRSRTALKVTRKLLEKTLMVTRRRTALKVTQKRKKNNKNYSCLI